MRLLVTGGAGFIGSATVRRALAAGHEVLNLDKLTYAANPDSLAAESQHPCYQFRQTDICDSRAMSGILSDFRPDALLNLAAETHVDRSIDGPGAFIRTNVDGVYTLLEACRHWLANGKAPAGFRFIQVSTDEVYGSIAEGAFNESSPYQPNSPYSASKASADMLVRAWHRTYDLPGIITNCSNNYGPWQFPEKFIPTIILKAIRGEPIPIYGDGQQQRDWLYVEDHADALLQVAELGVPGETYCIGGEAVRTNVDLARAVCDIVDQLNASSGTGSSHELIQFVEDRPGHDRRYAINHDKITQELGWRPSNNFQSGLEETVTWYLANSDWLNRLAETQGAGTRLGLGHADGGAS